VQDWVARDPLARLRAHLVERRLLDERTEAGFARDAEAIASDLRDALNADTPADPRALFEHVYATDNPQLEEQYAMLRGELERSGGEIR